MTSINVSGLMEGEGEGGSYVVKTEDGSVVQYIAQEVATQETGTDFSSGLELQQNAGQDLVSLAMESTKECELQEQDMVDEDWPDEIECQLIQKSVFLDGRVQTIDFIMCNQCPRLFKTEALLWQHIKAKHKRRSYRRVATFSPEVRRQETPRGLGDSQVLEPGEIEGHLQQPPSKSPEKLVQTPQAVGKEPLYVVGLDKSGGKLGAPTKPSPINNSFNSEKFQRQKIRKRIYVDSNSGPFKCPGCDNVTFSNRRSLDLHMKRLHKAGIVECDECGRKVLDLKRHKEILHKRFKIFDCPHCSDKFCTQDDLERHLAKIEKNNIVEGGQVKAVRQKTKPVKEPEMDVEKPQQTDKEKEDKTENEENVDTTEIVKELEAKTYSCSECGLKTHSRMTYIQHVLNGCIMDMVLGEVDNESPVSEAPARGRTPAKRGRKPGFKPSSDGAIRKRQKVDE